MRVVAAALTIIMIGLLSLTGCGDNDPSVVDEPAVGQCVMVQSMAAAVAAPPTPPAPEPKLRPIDAVVTGDAWTATGAGTLVGGKLTSLPTLTDPYCERTNGVTADLSLSMPTGGVDCTVKLSGDLAVLWQKPWVVLRPGTPYFCGAQDPRTLFTADLGAGWRTISSGGLEFPQVGTAAIVPVLPKALALRVSLQGDSAAHLGAVTATVHCRDTAP